MNRRRRLVIATIFAVMIPMAPAAAAPAPAQDAAPGAFHADNNRNGLSDSLEGRLNAARAHERFEVLVTWNGPANAAAAKKAVGPFTVLKEFTIIDGFLASVNAGQARALANVSGVFRVEENFTVQATNFDTDREYGTEQARADFGIDGSGVAVCVVDTGADPNHEQLDSNIVAFHDSINGLANPYDDQGHGSHVAATVAGDGTGGPNASTYQGIAPGADLYIAKALDAGGSGTSAQIIDAVEWCVAQGVKVITASLGGGPSDGQDALAQAFDNAVTVHGITATVAAGNSGDGPESVETPGAAPNVITVGASSKFKAGLRLAPFSSRGPNLAGVMKPDIVSPGVAVASAQANTTSGYVVGTGTSMATPFTAGAVALALQLDPTLTPSQIKTLMTSTALDAGVPGHDNNWGAGLIDGYGFLSTVAGNPTAGAFPSQLRISDSVQNNGSWSTTFSISGDSVGQPMGITILIDGEGKCTAFIFGICWISEWSPDLDARLIAPNGSVSESRCPLEFDCGSTGAQEVFYTTSAQEGTYTLEIYPFEGTGGPFDIDIFTGLPGAAPPDPNQDPIADAGSDQVLGDTDATPGEFVTLDGSGSTDPDGTIVSWEWSEGATPLGSGETLGLTLGDGVHTITLTVTDDDGATATDDVIVTVEAPAPDPNQDPIADAGSDQVLGDTDATPGEFVTLDGSGSTDPDGTIVSWEWSEGATPLGSGETLGLTLGDGVHTITLTVTDDDGATSTDDVIVAIAAPPAPEFSVHVGDLDASTSSLPKNRWSATATVTVHDEGDAVVIGATVWFALSTGETASCTTDAFGECSVSAPEYKKGTKDVTFTVTDVIASDPYNPGDNHDPDIDSDGTSITVQP